MIRKYSGIEKKLIFKQIQTTKPPIINQDLSFFQLFVRLNNTLKYSILVLRCKVYYIKYNRFTGVFIVSD